MPGGGGGGGGGPVAGVAASGEPADRFVLPVPGPMLPPVPAVVLGVAGDEERELPMDLTVVWSFILDGPNGQIGALSSYGH